MSISPPSTARIVIAEDHLMVREGLKWILSLAPGLEVVAETGDGVEAEVLARHHRPDLILLDLDLPGKTGSDVAAGIKQAFPAMKVVILTGCVNPRTVRSVLALGVDAYLLKRESSTELMDAVHAVLAGDSFISTSIVEQCRHWEAEAAALVSLLGQRERQVVVAVAEGKSSAEIAAKMFISVATVRKHRENILRKLKLRNAAEIAAFAVKYDLYPRL